MAVINQIKVPDYETRQVQDPNAESTLNKVTTISQTSTNTQYPSAQAVYNYGTQLVSDRAEKAKNPTAGNFAALDAQGNPTDSGKKSSDFDASGAAEKVKNDIADGTVTAKKAEQDGDGNIISDTYAPIESPTFTGTPNVPTAANGTSSPQIASTKFVQNVISAAGRVVNIKGHYDSLSALEAAVPNPQVGDAYSVGIDPPFDVYVFDGVTREWLNYGSLEGEPGKGLTILGYYATEEALKAAVTDPEIGDAYGIGEAEPYDIYIFDGTSGTWVNNGALQGAKGDAGAAAGFGSVWATIDANVGVPEVTVTATGSNAAKNFAFEFKNLKGETGATGAKGADGANGKDGAAAGFGTPTASVDANVGTPSVTVTASGADTAKVFSFDFKNLKGEAGAAGAKGDTGATGAPGAAAGFGSVTATVDNNVGTPEVSVTASGADTAKNFAFAFKNLKGEKGDTGAGFKVLGYYPTKEALEAAVTSPSAGDAYGIGTSEPYDIYIFDSVSNTWVNNGALQGAKGDKGDTGATGAPGAAAGFGSVTATVDNNVGTPEVSVTASGADTAKNFAFAFKNLKGEKGVDGANGKDGAAAGFGTPTASVDANVGTPSVTVTASGADTAKVFSFDFKNLKGEAGAKGDTGETGAKGDTGAAAGFGTVSATVDSNVGTPTVSVTASGADTAKNFAFTFKNLKGEQGIQGIQGEQGEQGIQGIQGEQGAKGDTGATGAPGAAAGFGSVTATVDNNVGTPEATVTTSGTDAAKNFAFAFKNLKGAKGDKGNPGADGAPGSDANVTKTNIEAALGADPLSLAVGGTGAATAAAARTNLGAQAQVKTASITLPVASWTGDDPYTQTVTISGVTAKSRIDLNPSAAVLSAAMEGGYGLVIGNNNGTVTVYAVGAKPAAAISVQVSITEVN